MTSIDYETGEQKSICDVCQMPISDLSSCFTKKSDEKLLTFCSEKCFKEYLENLELYTVFPDEEEEEE